MSPAFLFKNGLYIKALCQQKLDGRGQNLIHNIFKIDQQSLNKRFITSQQIFTCSKSTKEKLKVNIVSKSIKVNNNVFIVNSEPNSHHFLLFLLLSLNRKIFTEIVSSDYDTISSIHTVLNKLLHSIMHNKLLCRFFSNNKVVLSSTRTSYIIVQRNKHWNVSEILL